MLFRSLENFRGERGRRGSMLPRGLQRVTDIEIDSPQTAIDEQLTNS